PGVPRLEQVITDPPTDERSNRSDQGCAELPDPGQRRPHGFGTVVIWSERFGVLISPATLQPAGTWV
ncbi:MAG: hypothetical protein ACREJ0_11700, partial [Geminicoccaceae bacterium]